MTLDEICEMFDCSVLEDEYGDAEGNYCRCFVLGDNGDMSVGIYPYYLTDYFDSREELRAYAESAEGWQAINAHAAEIFSDWNPNKMDWD
jgi:hypothetical protein